MGTLRRQVAAVAASWLVRRLGGWGVEVPLAVQPELEAWLRLTVELLLELAALWMAARVAARSGRGAGFLEFSHPAPSCPAPRIPRRCRRKKG